MLLSAMPTLNNCLAITALSRSSLRYHRLLGFGEDGKASYADFSTQQMGLIYEPKFTDQIMGYPGLSGIVESVGTVDDWNYYIGQAMKLSAATITQNRLIWNPLLSASAQKRAAWRVTPLVAASSSTRFSSGR